MLQLRGKLVLDFPATADAGACRDLALATSQNFRSIRVNTNSGMGFSTRKCHHAPSAVAHQRGLPSSEMLMDRLCKAPPLRWGISAPCLGTWTLGPKGLAVLLIKTSRKLWSMRRRPEHRQPPKKLECTLQARFQKYTVMFLNFHVSQSLVN